MCQIYGHEAVEIPCGDTLDFLYPFADREGSSSLHPQPLVIPISGGGQSTTTKLGSGYTTRTTGGQSFSTTQLGSTTITRDSSGHTWRTKGVRSRLISLRFTLRAAIMQPTAQMPKLLGSQPAPAGMCSCMPDSSASLPIRIPAWI